MNPVFQLSGKRGLIVGLANDLSIAYGCARMAVQQGASVVTSCANEKALKYVQPLTDELGVTLHTCNVEEEGELEALVEKAVAELGGLDFVCTRLRGHPWPTCTAKPSILLPTALPAPWTYPAIRLPAWPNWPRHT